MSRILRVVLPVIAGAATFLLFRYVFPLRPWVSIAAATTAASLTLLGEVFDIAKKPLEVSKLFQENAKHCHAEPM